MLRRRLRQLSFGRRFSCLWIFLAISIIAYFIHFQAPFDFRFPFYSTSDEFPIGPDQESLLASDKVEALVENEIGRLAIPLEVDPPESDTCQIPSLDPFDPSILPFVDHPREVECTRVQQDLVFLDENGWLKLNKSTVKEIQNKGNVTCWYQYFDRGNTDQEIMYGEKYKLEKPTKMKKPFVKVACDQGSNSTRIFLNILANPAAINDQSLSSEGTSINVCIFGLKSASNSMVIRHLPKMLDHLNQTGAVIFKKFLKVGEDTISNLAAILTGNRSEKEQDDILAELPEPKDGFYDEWPMIWKDYRQKGYETVFIEDSFQNSIFYERGNGFKEKPVDRWYFPFWYAYNQTQRKDLGSESNRFCFGNEPIHNIFTDIVHGELTRSNIQNRRQFLFSLMNPLSNYNISDLERTDDTFFNLFHRLDSAGTLNRTILIVLSDQGPRFSNHRHTPIGFAEERLPFLAIRMPPFLYSRYPRLREILEINADSKLVSTFDIHETLLDVLNGVYDGIASNDPSIRGRSLFRLLPSDRTCFQAGIPDRYCLCDGVMETAHDHVAAIPAANAVLEEVNNMVEEYMDECAEWILDEILYFIRIFWPGEVGRRTKTYFIAFNAKPFDGKFEGVVVRKVADESVKFKQGTLNRINPIGEFGNCVSKSGLRKFCACKKYIEDE